MIEAIIVLIVESISAQSKTFTVRGSLIGVFEICVYNPFHLESAQTPAKANPQLEQKLFYCVLSTSTLYNVYRGHVTTIHT